MLRHCSGALFFVGLAAFVIRLRQDSDSAWINYVSNWLYFTSISIGGVLFAFVTWITKAKWNWSMRRVSQSFAAFLPISFVLAVADAALSPGGLLPVDRDDGDRTRSFKKKAAYLNIPFLVARNLVAGLLLLFGMALYFVYHAVRPDMGLTRGADGGDPARARRGASASRRAGWVRSRRRSTATSA